MKTWWRNACLKAGISLPGAYRNMPDAYKAFTKGEAKAALREAVRNSKLNKAKANSMVKKVLKKAKR